MRKSEERGRERRPVVERPAAPPPAPRLGFVRKRDGRVVPFQRQKIADAVSKALEAAGEPDPRFAAEVAGIVEFTLLEQRAPAEGAAAIPHIEAIQDLVERALMELGKSAVAKAFILYRDQRARQRAVLRVHRSDRLRAPVRVREREGVSDWSKGRIVVALMQEAELPREQAEDVASTVERRVFAAGKRSVTTGLIRELVASELFERGWLAALKAAQVVGLARLDVRRTLAGAELHAWRALVGPSEKGAPSAERVLAGELLARYALDNLLPDAVGELHRAGDVHVVGLESLGRPLTLCVETELLSGSGGAARAAYDLLDELAELAPKVARGIVLERPAALVSALLRTTRENSPHGLGAWLRALAALSHGARLQIDLGTSGARYHASSARLVEELAELDVPFAPRLFVEGTELEAMLDQRADLAGAIERLLAAGRLIPVWSAADVAFAGPGCERAGEERGLVACGGAIALNLPRIARRAGPFREELFHGALAELVGAAVEIAAALQPVQAAPLRSGVRARVAFALVPVGLREALLYLGDGTIDPELGARCLGFLGEAARRFSREGLLGRVPVPFFGAEAAARFAYLDTRAAHAEGLRQEWLFDDAEAALGEIVPYARGFVLSPLHALADGRAEGECLRTVPCGALPLDELRTRTAGAERPALEAWRRFELLRRAHSGELVHELFPEPRPTAPVAHLRPLV